MYTCWECLESFQSDKVLFEHLDKHFNETVKEESYFTDTVKTEDSGAGLGLDIGDSYIATSSEKVINSGRCSQVSAIEGWSSTSTINPENPVKVESIDTVRTQPSTGAFRCEYCDEEFQMKAHLIQHVYDNHRDLEYPVKLEQHEQSVTDQPGQSINQAVHPASQSNQLANHVEQSANEFEQETNQFEQSANYSEQSMNQIEQSPYEFDQMTNQPGLFGIQCSSINLDHTE
eukprot:154326_1